jgi:AraC-like DNA-binding protein
MYFYIASTISGNPVKMTWIHFIPFVFWFIYSIFYYIQPIELKQQHYLHYHYPEMHIALPEVPYGDDPLGIRTYVNELVMLQLTTYLVLSVVSIGQSFRKMGKNFFASGIKSLGWLRNFILFMFAILATFVVVKFTHKADIGDYLIASLISLVIYATSYNVIRASEFFQEHVSDPIKPRKKYEKSALQEVDKQRILEQIKQCMEKDKEYTNPLVSQPYISKKLGIPVHHISQVINEKLNQSFFEMIASYRMEEAKSLLQDSNHDHLTIEDLADEVGYNSKSAFNRSFKKHTGLTPSEYKKQL